MKFTLTADQISAMIADGVAKALAANGSAPQSQPTHFLPKGSRAAPSDLASKDAQIVATFKRRGFDAHLMDRNDPKVPFDDALPSATPPKGKKAKLTAVKS
jgi:hypothetical protein